MSPAELERFLDKVEPEPMSGCWLWTGVCSPTGYARMSIHDWPHYAHRLSYEHFVGLIPEGQEIDHKCRVRCCVNPDHLRAVTHAENLKAPGSLAGRNKIPKTHCPQGHSYEKHGRLNGDGCKICRVCWAAQMRQRRRTGSTKGFRECL